MNYTPSLLIYHPDFMQDTLPEESIERAVRLELLIEDVPLIQQLTTQAEVCEGEIHALRPHSGELYLSLFHTPKYIEEVKEICKNLRKHESTNLNDTFLSKESYNLACYAVGASIEAAKNAKQGKKSFAVVRPPGHHAHADKGDGFCIFNNIAIATEYLRRKNEKVLIIDTDLHVGDGTISYVSGKDNVFYYSLGQEKIWPFLDEENFDNVHLEFLPEGITDEIYISTLEKTIPLLLKQFQPDIIAVSAGFDTFAVDYVDYREIFQGGFCLSPKVYKSLWNLLDHSLIPYFAVLEGGYNPISICTGVMTFFDKNK
jgi:acetoin utilization deacetylase AcuC-like enzyme